MPVRYREDKATQAAALFLQLRGGRMSYLKLLKLLYLMDRAALVRWGRPVTFDWYYSMDHGPVLSFTYDRLKGEPAPDQQAYWYELITDRADHEVGLRTAQPPMDALSEAEVALIQELYAEFGHLSRWELRDLTHQLPEWRDPEGTSLPITYGDILLAEDFSEEEAADIEAELEAENFASSILS